MPELRLAKNIRILRDLYGYSQEQVSSQIHIARQTYSIYENGKRVPELTALRRLAEFYHVSIDYLLYADLSQPDVPDGMLRDHGAVAPDGSVIRINGSDAKMLTDYKSFPAEVQREVREFVRFKKYLIAKEKES